MSLLEKYIQKSITECVFRISRKMQMDGWMDRILRSHFIYIPKELLREELEKS